MNKKLVLAFVLFVGIYSINDKAIFSKKKGESCTLDLQCPTNYDCCDGRCRIIDLKSIKCTKNNECCSGHCVKGKCLKEEGEKCSKNADCFTNICWDKICRRGLLGECDWNRDCAQHLDCYSGICKIITGRNVKCTKNSECGSGKCSKNRCVKK
jgi:hypothetical protein